MIEDLKLKSQEINLNDNDFKENLAQMVKNVNFIQDFWIFRTDGIEIFNFIRDPFINKSIFDMYLTALNVLVKDLGHGDLKSFTINNKTYFIFKKNGYLFVASSLTDNKEKKITKFMEDFSNLFFFP
ncbi:MAG TPA: hypothetical protein VGB37_04885 [Candidatus Lokiarchaeia archaeon]